ncbi:MAG: hypothetical protein WDM89_18960 [Rhizomicrobium sp.]
MTGLFPVSDEQLHAFIDGELHPDETERIAKAIAEDTALSRQAAAYQADKAMIQNLFGPLVERPVPQAWIARIKQDARPHPVRRLAPWAAIAAALLIAVLSAPYFRNTPVGGEDSIIREAIAARGHSLTPQETLEAQSAAQLQTINAAMAQSLKMKLKAPDLERMGYRLASAQVYGDVPGGKSVELVYRGAGRDDLTIYVRRPNSAVRFDQFKRNELRICIWQDDVLGTVITGHISAAQMQRIASLAYTGLES